MGQTLLLFSSLFSFLEWECPELCRTFLDKHSRSKYSWHDRLEFLPLSISCICSELPWLILSDCLL